MTDLVPVAPAATPAPIVERQYTVVWLIGRQQVPLSPVRTLEEARDLVTRYKDQHRLRARYRILCVTSSIVEEAEG